jgi:hypothetical protein
MHRSAAILLLTLVLGAFVAASAGDGHDDRNDYDYDREPRMKQCRLKKPWRYLTHGCPTCNLNGGCITTTCHSSYDGKADVSINLKCLFGHNVGFVAVSYNNVCVNNQKGWKYDDTIVLSNLDCTSLPMLRFIVQDKWWFNKDGKELEISDSCYDKCTKGKPCHTCVFDNVSIPACDHYNCRFCNPANKEVCPTMLDNCFDFDRKYDYVKVTLKNKCRKAYSHIAVSYTGKDGKPNCADQTCKGDHDYVSFKAACKSSFTWFLEDKWHLNTMAPKCPVPVGDACASYFHPENVCDQCGPFGPVWVPDCKKRDHHDGHDKGWHN